MSSMPFWLDIVISIFLIASSLFALVGSIGLLKLKDFLQRLHGPTKASTLGVGFSLIASMLWFGFYANGKVGQELLITLFIFITAPISSHLMIKAAMHLDPKLRPPERPDQNLPQI